MVAVEAAVSTEAVEAAAFMVVALAEVDFGVEAAALPEAAFTEAAPASLAEAFAEVAPASLAEALEAVAFAEAMVDTGQVL